MLEEFGRHVSGRATVVLAHSHGVRVDLFGETWNEIEEWGKVRVRFEEKLVAEVEQKVFFVHYNYSRAGRSNWCCK